MARKGIRKAIIPAAGLGTRFLPVTKSSPKEMLPLVDKPLIQYAVEEAAASGISEIVIVTGRGKRAIEDHFDVSFELEETLKGNGKRDTLRKIQKISHLANFCYVRQSRPLGLGHAVLCAQHLIGDEPFAVLLGDEIIDSAVPALHQLITIYEKYEAPVIGIQNVARNEIPHYGIISPRFVADGLYQIVDLVEKPSAQKAPSDLAVVGRYILPPEIFDILARIPPGKNTEIQLTDGLKKLARHGPIYGWIVNGKRYDAGSKLGFLIATVEFALKNKELGRKFRSYLKTMKL